MRFNKNPNGIVKRLYTHSREKEKEALILREEKIGRVYEGLEESLRSPN